jgi:hypothetical protein
LRDGCKHHCLTLPRDFYSPWLEWRVVLRIRCLIILNQKNPTPRIGNLPSAANLSIMSLSVQSIMDLMLKLSVARGTCCGAVKEISDAHNTHLSALMKGGSESKSTFRS